jgi:F-type H+/Na+-transporting ATPase subunit alpha
MKKINETGDYNDEIAAELKKGVGDFVSTGSW